MPVSTVIPPKHQIYTVPNGLIFSFPVSFTTNTLESPCPVYDANHSMFCELELF